MPEVGSQYPFYEPDPPEYRCVENARVIHEGSDEVEDCDWCAPPATTEEETVADPMCMCGTELSAHSGWDNHMFVDAAQYLAAQPSTEGRQQ